MAAVWGQLRRIGEMLRRPPKSLRSSISSRSSIGLTNCCLSDLYSFFYRRDAEAQWGFHLRLRVSAVKCICIGCSKTQRLFTFIAPCIQSHLISLITIIPVKKKTASERDSLDSSHRILIKNQPFLVFL